MGISVNPRIQHAWAWNVCYKISCPSRNNKNDVLLILSENFITWPNLVRILCFQRAYLSSITKQLKKEQPDSGAGTRQKSAAKGEPTSLYQRCQIFPLTRDNLSHNVHTGTTQVMLWHNINQVWRSTVYSSTAAKKMSEFWVSVIMTFLQHKTSSSHASYWHQQWIRSLASQIVNFNPQNQKWVWNLDIYAISKFLNI